MGASQQLLRRRSKLPNCSSGGRAGASQILPRRRSGSFPTTAQEEEWGVPNTAQEEEQELPGRVQEEERELRDLLQNLFWDRLPLDPLSRG